MNRFEQLMEEQGCFNPVRAWEQIERMTEYRMPLPNVLKNDLGGFSMSWRNDLYELVIRYGWDGVWFDLRDGSPLSTSPQFYPGQILPEPEFVLFSLERFYTFESIEKVPERFRERARSIYNEIMALDGMPEPQYQYFEDTGSLIIEWDGFFLCVGNWGEYVVLGGRVGVYSILELEGSWVSRIDEWRKTKEKKKSEDIQD